MNSRQRVIRAIEHKEIDRYPIDLGAHFSTGISAFAYYNLRKYLGLSIDNIEICDNVQMLARVDEDILERFHCDAMVLRPKWLYKTVWNVRDEYKFIVSEKMNPSMDENGNWRVTDGERKMRMPEGGYFFDGDWVSTKEVNEEEEFVLLGKEAERIYKETDYFTILMGGFNGYFLGIDNACDMYTDPDIVMEQNKAMHSFHLKRFDNILNHMGGYIQAIDINSDLGTQSAPMISPDMYEQFCYPFLKELCSTVHNNSDIKLFLHSCGSIEPLLPYIIDAGVDILNPVQVSAGNMDPKLLKDKYGSKICFWGGGCNTQKTLTTGTVQDIKENVKALTDVFKVGGGFVFNQVHNIMGDVPPKNIVAMLDTAYENSFYK